MAPEMRPFHVTKTIERTKTVTVNAPNERPVVMAKRSKKTEKLMRGIDTFFSNPEHMGKLLPFLGRKPTDKKVAKTRISLRLIEWFVQDYCMQNSIDWFIGDEFFNVFLDYQTMMNEYRKKRFDCFGRKWRKEIRKDTSVEPNREYEVQVYYGIRFFYTDTDYVITTVAQLNFFRWMIEKKIIDYIILNRTVLVAEMRKSKKKRKTDETPKNKEQTDVDDNDDDDDDDEDDEEEVKEPKQTIAVKKVHVRATKRVTKKNVEVYVSFD